MSISTAFDHGKAFIPFVTAGDPDLATTAALVRAMEGAGADLVELGVPFSDPTAEGPVIQAANIRSLAAGTTTDGVLELVRELRAGDGDHAPVRIPLVLMTYANVVFSRGVDAFAAAAAAAGVDGVILPDVPFEERSEFAAPLSAAGVSLVSMVAPTSHERVAMIACEAQGFVYCVSSLGVTGMRREITTDVEAMVEAVRDATDVPVAVGFGISTPAQAARMAAVSDGAIVGSAIVRIVGERGRDSVRPVAAYVRAMGDAVHRV